MRGLYDGEYQFVPPWLPGPGRHAGRLRRLDRPAAFVESARPVHLHERRARQEPAGRAIEHVEEAVAIGPQHHLRRRAAPVHVDEHRHLHRVVVVAVVGRELVVPLQLAGVGVERDDRVGIEVVAGPLIGIPVGPRIADAPVGQVQRRIVRTGDPDRAAAVLPRVALPGFVPGSPGAGNRVEPPELLAGLRARRRR